MFRPRSQGVTLASPLSLEEDSRSTVEKDKTRSLLWPVLCGPRVTEINIDAARLTPGTKL